MLVNIYRNTLEYVYDKDHHMAHYIIDGCDAYRNRGQLVESICKHHRGLFSAVNPSTRWDNGSDIEEEYISIKSDKASLGMGIIGDTKEELITMYMEQVHSNCFIWADFNEKTGIMTEYQMNKVEFEKFLNEFTFVSKYSNGKVKIEFPRTTKRMRKWFQAV